MEPKHINTIITYLIDNPLELVYDPEDDECSDSFELERYLTVSVQKTVDGSSTILGLHYYEFD